MKEMQELIEAAQEVIDERDSELDMMTCKYPRGTLAHEAWHDGVYEMRKRLAVIKDSLKPAIAAARAHEGGWRDARNQALREAAIVASHFTMGPDARIHPDIAWDEMNETAKLVAHTTAQQISMAISDLLPSPPLSVEKPTKEGN